MLVPGSNGDTVDATSRFTPVHVGSPIDGKPWVSHVTTVDLDDDGLDDILACDDKLLAVVWLRQEAPGEFVERTIGDDIPSPVHVEPADIDLDGDVDLLVACMGVVFPNNDKIGSIIILENDGNEVFRKHVIEERITRVTDVRAADFNRDGRVDLAVAQFGYDQGEIRWLENLGDWNFRGHQLLNLSGTINVCIADFDGNQTMDIVALVSQQWEEIHLFQNDGSGGFTRKVVFGSTNEDFGSSGISLSDLNGDGRLDILYTNGDGFAYADPGLRPWHGVQWLENLSGGFFRYHRIADMAGAYSPIGVDLDGNGAMDVLCVSGFNDWDDPEAASVVVFQNDGSMNFSKHVLAHAPTHLISVTTGDFVGNGRPSFATAGFHSFAPFDRMSRLTVWKQTDVQ